MSLPLRPSLIPQCRSCTRRLANSATATEWLPARQQVRGKRKLANTPSTITVRLLKDVPTFGRKGAIVPISIGQLRNDWYPRRTAEYVTDAQLKELKLKNVAMERDFQFGITTSAKDRGASGKRDLPTAVRAQLAEELNSKKPVGRHVEVERISPERSIQLLEILLPPRLEFFRKAIEPTPEPAPAPVPVVEEAAPAPAQRPQQRSRSVSSAASDLLAARSQPGSGSSPAFEPIPVTPASGSQAIFGSVSSLDVATAMKAVLAENDEAARVLVGEEDVRFVNVKDEAGKSVGETDRVKTLGDFEVEVRIRGEETVVKRVVRVSPRVT